MQNEKIKLARRDVLRALGVGAGAAAMAPTLGSEARADTESDSEKRKTRYQETDHVKAYYRVNRYPNSK